MKAAEELPGKGTVLLTGKDTLDLYTKKIIWNLRSIMGQIDLLEATILAIKKAQREQIETKTGMAA